MLLAWVGVAKRKDWVGQQHIQQAKGTCATGRREVSAQQALDHRGVRQQRRNSKDRTAQGEPRGLRAVSAAGAPYSRRPGLFPQSIRNQLLWPAVLRRPLWDKLACSSTDPEAACWTGQRELTAGDTGSHQWQPNHAVASAFWNSAPWHLLVWRPQAQKPLPLSRESWCLSSHREAVPTMPIVRAVGCIAPSTPSALGCAQACCHPIWGSVCPREVTHARS